ncbi:hypothetical protein BRCON_1670 [Candidatus Sumerlaea chitinivorans]|uniref:Uncharacterized protein n=1 Tax=Sumerlaea chitinivorans TaxID=2250252 RepID=A0A2Z4Y5G0_SUMC1|nr:hypothetical protein BRCON_1670 [Candidatus Sumerlaea chitinivorans]
MAKQILTHSSLMWCDPISYIATMRPRQWRMPFASRLKLA